MFQRPNERLSWVCVSKSSDYTLKDVTLQCDYCEGEYGENELPAHHRISHREEINNRISESGESLCGTCINIFPSKVDLIKHTLSSHLYSSDDALRVQHEIYVCDYCNQIYFTKLTLTNHILFRHLYKRPTRANMRVKCHYCKKSILMCNYWVHTTKHATHTYSVYCFKCDAKFINQSTLKQHLRQHPKHYYCDICKYYSETESSFNIHVQSHRNSIKIPSNEENIERYFITPYINDVWEMRKALFFSGVWLPEDLNICVLCREICYSEMEMRRHIQSHKPVDAKKYLCECGKNFSSTILLKFHKFRDHNTNASTDTKRRKSPEIIQKSSTETNTISLLPNNDIDGVDELPNNVIDGADELPNNDIDGASLEINQDGGLIYSIDYENYMNGEECIAVLVVSDENIE